MNKRYRGTYVEVDLNHLYNNYQNAKNMAGGLNLIPVVKANAYGHGAKEVVEFLYEKGVDHFAVSLLEEALELREIFPNIRILTMGIVQKDGLIIASENDITVTISNFNQISDLKNLTKQLRIHVKIDSGMNRLGFKTNEDICNAMSLLKKNRYVDIEGIFTHFSTADVDKSYYDIQLNRFIDVLNLLKFDFRMIHISNSSSVIKYERDISFTTHGRLGISLYGLTLDSNVNFLKSTFKLKTTVSEIKHLLPGDKVGYGATYTSKEEEKIAVLPIGYADGFIRKNQNGDVEIHGKRYPIVGRICMDQMFVKIDDSVKFNDEVTLFGGIVSIDEVANRLETINYEVICQITSRVPREYKR